MPKFYRFELKFNPYKNKDILDEAKYMIKNSGCSSRSCNFCPLNIEQQTLFRIGVKDYLSTGCIATTIARMSDEDIMGVFEDAIITEMFLLR